MFKLKTVNYSNFDKSVLKKRLPHALEKTQKY